MIQSSSAQPAPTAPRDVIPMSALPAPRSRRAQLVTVGDVLSWFAERDPPKGSAVGQQERVRQREMFAARFGSLALADCCAADLQDFIDGQAGAKSNWTKRRIRATIARPFNQACRLGLITRNPFAGLQIPEGDEGRDWTDVEYRAVLRNSHPYFRLFVVFLRYSGARPGEGRTLEWSQVRAEIRAIIQRDHKTAHTSKEPRRIRLNHITLKLFAWMWTHRAGDRWVFVNSYGRPWTIKALSKHLLELRRRIGLEERVKMHGLRHTFATRGLMRMGKADIYLMSKLLGHASVKTTERYLHLLDKDEFLDDAAERAIGGK